MTQSILIGSPLELTHEGILELHKLKNKETYIYLIREEDLPFSPHSEVKLVSEEAYLHSRVEENTRTPLRDIYRYMILPYYVKPHEWGADQFQKFLDEVERIRKIAQKGVHEALYFEDHWRYPSEEDRTDVNLLYLHRSNPKKYFTEGTRKIVIPKDVKWKICSTYPFDREYIQEKARTWG